MTRPGKKPLTILQPKFNAKLIFIALSLATQIFYQSECLKIA